MKFLNGNIEEVMLYKEALIDQQIIELTTI